LELPGTGNALYFPVKTLEIELRKVDKAESWAIGLAAAVSILSTLFLLYAALISL
jgi:hypothetical protein